MADVIENVPLRRGIDYDLVNISLIGHDPVTGRSFEECDDEWREAVARVRDRAARLRWWNIPERFRIARQSFILHQRLGMS